MPCSASEGCNPALPTAPGAASGAGAPTAAAASAHAAGVSAIWAAPGVPGDAGTASVAPAAARRPAASSRWMTGCSRVCPLPGHHVMHRRCRCGPARSGTCCCSACPPPAASGVAGPAASTAAAPDAAFGAAPGAGGSHRNSLGYLRPAEAGSSASGTFTNSRNALRHSSRPPQPRGKLRGGGGRGRAVQHALSSAARWAARSAEPPAAGQARQPLPPCSDA